MHVDVVIIGVNASSTLERCISSVLESDYPAEQLHVVYVDGGSTDESVLVARKTPKVQVLELTPDNPTPGLGRNAGWRNGDAPVVMFLDSDTILDPRFISLAVQTMRQRPDAVAVFGDRVERYPEKTSFNWIANLEWNPAPGEVDAFGGDVMIRRTALEQADGYDEELVAGEDPDLAQRILEFHADDKTGNDKTVDRRVIVHLQAPMTAHDIAMDTVGQYWRRGFRTGYGYAAVAARSRMRSNAKSNFWRYEQKRILIRGGGGPLAVIAGALGAAAFSPAFALLLCVGALLVLYPRVFSVRKFMRDKDLSLEDAQLYAWHCSLVVIPEFCGLARYIFGSIVGAPLRNKPAGLRTKRTSQKRGLLIGVLVLALFSGACAHVEPTITAENPDTPTFGTEEEEINVRFATAAAIEAFSEQAPDEYLLGPGDVLNLSVWNRPEISEQGIVVAPDGDISVMRIGVINVRDRTVEEVSGEIAKRLSEYYETPEVRLTITEFKNNKAYVLGRVTNPGLVSFQGKGTLLEALSMAGGLPLLREEAFLTNCAIIRGKSNIIWIDLRDLLRNGNMALNARIMNNDVIYIPESENELCYIMGEVLRPGVVRLKSQLTLMDALMMAGGPTEDANLTKVFIIRQDGVKKAVKRIDVRHILESADFGGNFLLKDNDVVYVAAKGVANLNYVIRQIMPALELLSVGVNALEGFGVLPYARHKWYGCLDCDEDSDSNE